MGFNVAFIQYNEVYITTAPDFKSRARTTSPSGETREFEPVTITVNTKTLDNVRQRPASFIRTRSDIKLNSQKNERLFLCV